MQNDAAVTYFPVGNGDTSLITIPDAVNPDRVLNLMLDCNIRDGDVDVDGNEIFDVHAQLLDVLPRDPQGRTHLDVFILSHPDEDHCRGYDRVFYAGDPDDYTDEDKKVGRILVDEVWFAPRIFWPWEELCVDAESFKEEAERRMEVHKTGAERRNDAGNRLRVIGYSDNPDLEGLDDVLTIPGDEVNIVDNKEQPHFRFSVLAPVRKDTDDELGKRNDTSIVLLARFDVDDQMEAVRALFGGDSGVAIWQRIVEVNDQEALSWDLFLAPHHCSWHFFSEKSHLESSEPEQASMDVLDCRRTGAYILGSCKPIQDDDDDPPSYKAAELYIQAVTDSRFLCTGETPSEAAPKPIVFLMTSNGPVIGESPQGPSKAAAAVKQTASTPQTYG